MDVGLAISVFDIDGGTAAIAGELARAGAAAGEAGATSLSLMDHYFQIEATGRPAESQMLEGYTTLGYLAAHTSTVKLGLLVTGVTYRHPGLLARIVTTLDGRPIEAGEIAGVQEQTASAWRELVKGIERWTP